MWDYSPYRNKLAGCTFTHKTERHIKGPTSAIAFTELHSGVALSSLQWHCFRTYVNSIQKSSCFTHSQWWASAESAEGTANSSSESGMMTQRDWERCTKSEDKQPRISQPLFLKKRTGAVSTWPRPDWIPKMWGLTFWELSVYLICWMNLVLTSSLLVADITWTQRAGSQKRLTSSANSANTAQPSKLPSYEMMSPKLLHKC